MYFSLLPHDCILLIIYFMIQSDSVHSNRRDLKKWKTKLTRNQICGGVWWYPPPFTSIFPLIFSSIGMKDIFDTNEVWTYLYEQEFRCGKPYKRKPLKAKERMFLKSNQIIKAQYVPVLESHKQDIRIFKEKLRINLHQLHTLEVALSTIKPQIKDRKRIDKHIDKIAVVLPPTIILPEGYIRPWGVGASSVPMRIDVSTASGYLTTHRVISESMIKSINNSKGIINKIVNGDGFNMKE